MPSCHPRNRGFPPLTGLQVLSTRVEGAVLVVEARLSVNLVSLTIEEVVAKRYRMAPRRDGTGVEDARGALRIREEGWLAMADHGRGYQAA